MIDAETIELIADAAVLRGIPPGSVVDGLPVDQLWEAWDRRAAEWLRRRPTWGAPDGAA
jgi:hypothetical protein